MNNSKGIVLFAYDSGYEYVKIANVSAALAKTHLGLPVTLITDVFGALKANMKYIDNVIVCESPDSDTRSFRETHDKSVRKIEWKNFNRARVYDLTPYEQTLLIDCDFMINSRALINLFKKTSFQSPMYTEAMLVWLNGLTILLNAFLITSLIFINAYNSLGVTNLSNFGMVVFTVMLLTSLWVSGIVFVLRYRGK